MAELIGSADNSSVDPKGCSLLLTIEPQSEAEMVNYDWIDF